jgi:hypothetical protein
MLETNAASRVPGSLTRASRNVPPRLGISAADDKAVVNRDRERMITEANEVILCVVNGFFTKVIH